MFLLDKSLLCLLPVQRNPHLPSSTEDLLNSHFNSANLHTIPKNFTLIHQSINKSKYVTHPRYIAIIRRF